MTSAQRKPPRYTDTPFPAYRYLPFQGDMPHPRNDPEGHSYGLEDEYLPTFSPEDWTTCQPYLYGVDLFNYGYWWEAHESWETVWMAAGRDTRSGTFIQGLIQIAAGQLKRVLKEARGTQLLTHSGLDKLAVAEGIFLGIGVATLRADIETSVDNDTHPAPTITLLFPETP